MTLVGRLIEGWLIGGWMIDDNGKGWQRLDKGSIISLFLCYAL